MKCAPPSCLSVDEQGSKDGEKHQGLTASSFFHHALTCDPGIGLHLPDFLPLAADQAGHARSTRDAGPASFDFEANYKRLADLASGSLQCSTHPVQCGQTTVAAPWLSRLLHSVPDLRCKWLMQEIRALSYKKSGGARVGFFGRVFNDDRRQGRRVEVATTR